MNNNQLMQAMHNPAKLYTKNGLVLVKPNICERTFVVCIDNPNDINICTKCIGRRCYRKFFGGQMEQVLDELVEISFISTPSALLEVVRELRKLGVQHKIDICVEYVEGHPIHIITR